MDKEHKLDSEITDFLPEDIHHTVVDTQAFHGHREEQRQIEIVHGDACEPTRQCARFLVDGCQQEYIQAEQVEGKDQQNAEVIVVLLVPNA